MADSLAMIGVLLCGICAAGMLICYAKNHHSESSQLDRLRRTAAYKELKAKLSLINRHDFDEVRVECSGSTVTSVCPAHIVLKYSFKQNGNSVRNDSYTKLFAELIAQDLPFLTEKKAYKLYPYKVYRPNGKIERAYAFIMRRAYKDYLLYERNMAELKIY
ncbi:MAG: hypothetical protein QM308_01435 [Bacillota bacterium]|nr:hypothetical protein [Bacillota bacterium]